MLKLFWAWKVLRISREGNCSVHWLGNLLYLPNFVTCARLICIPSSILFCAPRSMVIVVISLFLIEYSLLLLGKKWKIWPSSICTLTIRNCYIDYYFVCVIIQMTGRLSMSCFDLNIFCSFCLVHAQLVEGGPW